MTKHPINKAGEAFMLAPKAPKAEVQSPPTSEPSEPTKPKGRQPEASMDCGPSLICYCWECSEKRDEKQWQAEMDGLSDEVWVPCSAGHVEPEDYIRIKAQNKNCVCPSCSECPKKSTNHNGLCNECATGRCQSSKAMTII